MTPYYEQDGIVIYHGDCREVMPTLQAEVVITDPVWPNCPPGLIAGSEDPYGLWADICRVLPSPLRQMVVVMRNDSDPRFLAAVPASLRFQQVTWLQYVMPGYLGRVLGGNECGYVFGEAVKRVEGRKVIPSISPKAQPLDRPKNGHPCSRAQVHMDWLVTWFSDPHETILDPCCGSGKTLVAAKRLGRKGIGIDIEERWCELAASELAQGALPMEFSA